MNKWSTIAAVGVVVGAVAVHELELQPGVEHSHTESASGPDVQIGRAAMEAEFSEVSVYRVWISQ